MVIRRGGAIVGSSGKEAELHRCQGWPAWPQSPAGVLREDIQPMGEELADPGRATTQRSHWVLKFRNKDRYSYQP